MAIDVEVTRPVRECVREIGSDTTAVSFEDPLTDEEARIVAEAMRPFRQITLIVGTSCSSRPFSLKHLRHFEGVRGLRMFATGATSLEPIEALGPHLDHLALGHTKQTYSLRPLAACRSLRYLEIWGHSRDLNVIWNLDTLEALYLRSISLQGLNSLARLPNLWWLWLGLGGTSSIAGVEAMRSLRYLEIWQVRGLADIEPIAEATRLEELYLQSLRQVERLPSLLRMEKLRRITLETMKGLNDLSELANAPALGSV